MRGLLKFTLDLFGPGEAPLPAVPDAAPGARPPRRRARPKAATPPPQPTADIADGRPATAPLVGPAVPATPLADAITPASFSHPRATRQVRLGDADVAYEFTRAKRRTIGFVVGSDGLSVRAPRWVALREVDAALQEKAGWILRKLGETQQRQARLDSTRIDWADGAVFPYLGASVVVRLDPSHAFAGSGASLDAAAGADGAVGADGESAVGADGADGADAADGPRHGEVAPQVLRLAVARDASPAQIRDAAQAWLMRQARRVFIERLDHFAPQLGVRWHKLSLSNAATRWGSASIDGAIRLHWRLIHFRLDIIDYVVAHELSHLRVMDHSPRFWDTVESVVPDYARLRKQLKDEPVPRWN